MHFFLQLEQIVPCLNTLHLVPSSFALNTYVLGFLCGLILVVVTAGA